MAQPEYDPSKNPTHIRGSGFGVGAGKSFSRGWVGVSNRLGPENVYSWLNVWALTLRHVRHKELEGKTDNPPIHDCDLTLRLQYQDCEFESLDCPIVEEFRNPERVHSRLDETMTPC